MALSQDRNTPNLPRGFRVVPVAANTKIFAGSLVAINASNYAVPGSVSTTLKGLGRAECFADNSAGAAGDISVEVRPGIFKFKNSASADAISRKDIGKTCFIVDDETVALTNGTNTRSEAGRIYDVDSDGGVWVDFY